MFTAVCLKIYGPLFRLLPADLWAELSEASGIDVASFMNPWLERPGFPVLTITENGTVTEIKQEHFSDNPEKADPGRLWPVPLFSSHNSLPAMTDEAGLQVEADGGSVTENGGLIRLNTRGRGHYIVRYATEHQRNKLKELIADHTLDNSERLLALNDTSMLARAGYLSYGEVLELLAAYADESNESVWDMIGLIVAESRRFIDYDPGLESKIKLYVRTLVDKQFTRLGWDEQIGESSSDQKLRAMMLSLGAYAEHPAILEEANKRFAAYQKDPAGLSSEIRAVVFGVPVKQGNQEAFDYFIKLHDDTSNSDLKGDVSAALTITRDPDNASRLLERIKDSRIIKPQDADRWLVYLLRNRYVRDTSWDFMVDQWSWFEQTFKNDKSYDYLPRYAASCCNSPEYAQKYREFFTPKLEQIVLKRNIQIGFEEIDNRLRWMERDLKSVQNFFNKS